MTVMNVREITSEMFTEIHCTNHTFSVTLHLIAEYAYEIQYFSLI